VTQGSKGSAGWPGARRCPTGPFSAIQLERRPPAPPFEDRGLKLLLAGPDAAVSALEKRGDARGFLEGRVPILQPTADRGYHAAPSRWAGKSLMQVQRNAGTDGRGNHFASTDLPASVILIRTLGYNSISLPTAAFIAAWVRVAACSFTRALSR
jgi:hypothetical protein